jgi:hypothetical protein
VEELWKLLHIDPSTKTEYDEQMFEQIEKIKSAMGIKKQVTVKNKN